LGTPVWAAPGDDAAGAKSLIDIWNRNESKMVPQRKDVARIRAKRVEQERRLRKERDQKKRAAIRTRIAELVEDYIKVDRKLSPLELRRVALLEAIRGLKSPEAVQWLCTQGLGRAKDPLLRRTIAQVVIVSDHVDAAAFRAALAQSKKPELAVPLLQALARGKIGSDDSLLAVVLGFLENRDWAVRVAAGYALAALADPQGVEPIIVALKGSANRSREQRELARALARLTGQSIGPYPDLWQKWWGEQKENVLAGRLVLGKGAPRSASKSEQGHFYGIPQTEDRIIYILDISGSMEVSMINPQWIDGAAVPAADDEESRYEAALRELLRATRRLRPRSHFAVFVYSSKARALHEKMMPASKENLAKLEQEFAHLGPEGSTNIYEALQLALQFAGVSSSGVTGRRKQLADAIYLLSDGSPTDAKGKSEDPQRTLLAVREWNALNRIAIHTIGIGKQHSRAFMEQLARDNGGEYYAVGSKKKRKK